MQSHTCGRTTHCELKWVITPVIDVDEYPTKIPCITGVITHLRAVGSSPPSKPPRFFNAETLGETLWRIQGIDIKKVPKKNRLFRKFSDEMAKQFWIVFRKFWDTAHGVSTECWFSARGVVSLLQIWDCYNNYNIAKSMIFHTCSLM